MPDMRSNLLGKLLVESGLVSREQIQECLEEQAKSEKLGKPVKRLGDLLVEKGYLTASEIDKLARKAQAEAAQGAVARKADGEKSVSSDLAEFGDAFADFDVKKRLGGDSAGSVYLAIHRPSGAMVSLRVRKHPEDEHAEIREARDSRFKKARRLRYPGIQRIITAGHLNNWSYYAGEYLNGLSLRQLLEKGGPLPWELAVEMIYQIALGLRYGHENGMSHGELRPADILIDDEGRTIITSYPLTANPYRNLAKLIESAGETPVYIAPEERKDGAVSDDPRADIYSLGAVFYRAVTGKPHFIANSVELLAETPDFKSPREINPAVPEKIDNIIMKMLRDNPAERPENIDAVVKELEPFLADSLTKRLKEATEGVISNRLSKMVEERKGDDDGETMAERPEHRDDPSKTRVNVLKEQSFPVIALIIMGLLFTVIYNAAIDTRRLAARAEQYYSRGNTTEAMALFRQALNRNPRNLALLERVAGLGEEIGDFQAATAALIRLERLAPIRRNEWKERLGDLHLRQRSFDEAARYYNSILERNPGRFEVRIKLAQALQWGLRFEEAMAVYERILQESPDDQQAMLALAQSAFYGGFYDKAHETFERYLETVPHDARARLEYADSLAAAGMFDKAAEQYRWITEKHPDSRRAPQAYARTLLWDGQYEKALDALLALHNPQAPSASIVRSMATAYQGLGKINEVVKCFEILRQIDPYDIRIAKDLVNWYQAVQEFEKAAELAEEYIKRAPGDTELIKALARSYAWSGETEKAIDAYENLLARLPESKDIRTELAGELLRNRQPDEAIPHLEWLTEREPDDLMIKLDLARAYTRVNMRDKASQLVEEVARQDEARAEHLMELAELEIQTTEGEARLYEEWMRRYPRDTSARRRFAHILRAVGRHEEAWEVYSELAELYPQDRQLLIDASEVASWAGKPREAIRLLESARNLQAEED